MEDAKDDRCNTKLIVGSSKLEKTRFGVAARILEGLGTSGRLGLKGLLLFMYPNRFSSGSFTAWRAVERFFAEFFGFLFDNTSLCYLCVASLFPYFLPFNYCYFCD